MSKLSIVIPVFNEQNKISRDILAADQFLTSEGLAGEIILVDDGSKDDTAKIAEKVAQTIQAECVIESLKEHRGKGFAVRTGILKSRGDFVAFSDSGCCVPYEEIQLGVNLISSGRCQIAHGSRKLANGSILQPQPLYRQVCSKIFHWFLIHDIKRVGNLTDTQCGFKVYRGDIARELYSSSQIDGFMFDVEIILLALSQGYNILEFPVNWRCDPDSRLKPLHESWRVFRDLVRLKKRFGKFLADNTP
ncbi:MAG: glycosyltransferase [Planctomycetes bacterium]|nr:glycosyltransferase [Planctomycetota bacterium]